MVQAAEGLKVLDLSRFLPGPLCSGVLADFGADVIRVEEPFNRLSGRRSEQSSGTSSRPMLFTDESPSKVRAYDSVGRNKRSIIVDLKQEKGKQIAYQLCTWADVFLEEFRPGVAKRLGLDYDTVRGINPSIVYCSISLFGQDGPYRDLPGHDPVALAVAGSLSLCASEGEAPRMLGVAPADIISGFSALAGVLMALRTRDITGRGQHVDVSMTDSALRLLSIQSQPYFMGKRVPKMNLKNPSSGVWETLDGKFICTTNMEPYHWANFCRVIGREDLIPRQYDRKHRVEMHETVKRVFLSKSREEWLRLLHNPDCETQAAPVNDVDEAFSDLQILHRQMVMELTHPEFGKVRQLGIDPKLSETPGTFRFFAPRPGEHTNQVLGNLGYSVAQIAELRENCVVE